MERVVQLGEIEIRYSCTEGAVDIDDGLLRVTSKKNGNKYEIKWYDAEKRLKKYQLGQDVKFDFDYDWNGRLASVTMPNGETTTLEYDSFGRKKYVRRSKLGMREYIYQPRTGLLDQVLSTNESNNDVHSKKLEYDKKGRVVKEVYKQGSAVKEFVRSYDGASAFGETYPNQLGFQSGERGEEYSRNTQYSVNGRLEREQKLFGERWLLNQQYTYEWDGFVKDRDVSFKDIQTGQVKAYHIKQSRDKFGRLFQLLLDDQVIMTLNYDELGRIKNIQESSGRIMELSYDRVTQAYSGWKSDLKNASTSYAWHYDDRGLIAAESFITPSEALSKTYAYDEAEFLNLESSPSRARSYTYAMSLRQEQTNMGLDSFGRRLATKGLSLSYGTDGQLQSSVSPTGLFKYVYDGNGQRVLKYRNGELEQAYAGDLMIRQGQLFQKIEIQSILLGLVEQGKYRPVFTDSRGTPFFAEQEGLKVPMAFGEEALLSQQDVLSYAGFGKDIELGWIRFGVRDYDPDTGLFTSPDPLFLESPERCVESPVECNLYSYAKIAR